MSPIGKYIFRNAAIDRHGVLSLPFFALPGAREQYRIRRAILAHLAVLNRMSAGGGS